MGAIESDWDQRGQRRPSVTTSAKLRANRVADFAVAMSAIGFGDIESDPSDRLALGLDHVLKIAECGGIDEQMRTCRNGRAKVIKRKLNDRLVLPGAGL